MNVFKLVEDLAKEFDQTKEGSIVICTNPLKPGKWFVAMGKSNGYIEGNTLEEAILNSANIRNKNL